MAIKEALLPEFDQEMATTRKVLERLPTDKLEWTPHPRSMAMGRLGTHVGTLYDWMIKTLTLDSFDVAPVDGEPYRLPDFSSTAAIVERFEALGKAARAALAEASDEHLMQPWSLLQGGQTLFTMPRLVVLRSFVFNHLIHHRGQLSLYLRLNDVPVPAIYGPSADEGQM
ncbi:MAG: DinB family protein [Acidobacteria bacterium]|nr:DinB family protein [Acidobacteriota bacterium]MBI3422197.1 DinB family protein [Acidobacteriota bacterium]